MAFRDHKQDCLVCKHIYCKMCLTGQGLREEGVSVHCSWKDVLAFSRKDHVTFYFYNVQEKTRNQVILLYNEVYLVHIWGMYETHGLTALYNAGQSTLEDLAHLNDDRLRSIRGFGRKSFEEVKRIQGKYLNRKLLSQVSFNLG